MSKATFPIVYTNISPNKNPRKDPKYNPTGKVLRITPHHAAGVVGVKSLTDYLGKSSTGASANYTIGNDGQIGLNVPEDYRAQTSSSRPNDFTAITFEISNSATGGNWPISDAAIEAFIVAAIDICKRHAIPKLYYDGTPNGTLTLHEMFANTVCPGAYFKSKIPYICGKVNAGLESVPAPTVPAQNVTYYVQTGAYTVKTNADAQLAKVKAAGFDAIIKQAGNLYRVQTGAYSVKVNAEAQREKLIKAGFEAVVTTEGGTFVPANPESAFLPGDVNGNGKLDADDARMAQRAAAKLETLTEEQLKAADINGDSKLTAADPREILRKSAGLE
jgi:hypothetical protein